MGYPTKIATCCHCGTRAALTLDRGRHELACANCGAPLHALKSLPVDRPAAQPAVSHQPRLRGFPDGVKGQKKAQKKRPKRRKSLWHRIAEEAFDVVEDIFD